MEIHTRAAEWYLQAGNYEEAIYHLTAAKNFDAAALALNSWGSSLLANAELKTFERWFLEIPFEHVRGNTPLLIKASYAMIFLRRRDVLKNLISEIDSKNTSSSIDETTDQILLIAMSQLFEDRLTEAFQICLDQKPSDTPGTIFSNFERGANYNLQAFCQLATSNFISADHSLSLARYHSEKASAGFSAGYQTGIKFLSKILQGRPREILDKFYDDTYGGLNQDSSINAISAVLAACKMWALYEVGRISSVLVLWNRFQNEIAETGVPDFMSTAHIFASRAYVATGDYAKAFHALDTLERIALASNWERIVRLVNWERIRISICHGKLSKANSFKELMSGEPIFSSGWIYLSEDFDSELLGQIRLDIHNESYVDAKKNIAKVFASTPSDRVYRVMKIQILKALLAVRSGNEFEALRTLNEALRTGYEGGFTQCFIDEGEDVLHLLAKVLDEHKDQAFGDENFYKYIKNILDNSSQLPDVAFEKARKLPQNSRSLLSDKQYEMLKMLAAGLSNKDMAKKMFVSENTVKFHLKNVYSILGVASRTQAIALASEQGLIN